MKFFLPSANHSPSTILCNYNAQNGAATWRLVRGFLRRKCYVLIKINGVWLLLTYSVPPTLQFVYDYFDIRFLYSDYFVHDPCEK